MIIFWLSTKEFFVPKYSPLSILIDLDGEGWKFNAGNNNINVDNGLYFGKKNSFNDNQNIIISGMTNEENQKSSNFSFW